MEFCQYCKVGGYTSVCVCKITGNMCPLVRKCSTEIMYKPLPTMKDCSICKSQELILGKNEYKVRFEKDGYLYVEYGDTVITVKNTYDEVPKSIKIVPEKTTNTKTTGKK